MTSEPWQTPIGWLLAIFHLHHMATWVPNYRLRECFASHPRLQRAPRLTLRTSLRSAPLRLWDAAARRMIPFSALGTRAHA